MSAGMEGAISSRFASLKTPWGACGGLGLYHTGCANRGDTDATDAEMIGPAPATDALDHDIARSSGPRRRRLFLSARIVLGIEIVYPPRADPIDLHDRVLLDRQPMSNARRHGREAAGRHERALRRIRRSRQGRREVRQTARSRSPPPDAYARADETPSAPARAGQTGLPSMDRQGARRSPSQAETKAAPCARPNPTARSRHAPCASRPRPARTPRRPTNPPSAKKRCYARATSKIAPRQNDSGIILTASNKQATSFAHSYSRLAE